MSRRRRLILGAAHAATWVVLTAMIAAGVFFGSSRTVVVASHDSQITPTLSGKVVIMPGPVLPDLRVDSGAPIGVDIMLGKTDATSTEELVQRYGLLASQPEGTIAKVEGALKDMAIEALIRGGVLALIPILLWLLIGAERRRELIRSIPTKRGGLIALLILTVVAGLWAPWQQDERDNTLASDLEWTSLQDFVGPEIPVPEQASGVEVLADVTTAGTLRLIQSAVDTYDRSQKFYAAAEKAAADVEVRQPEEGETVVAMVSDRHDNIGMDEVARAVADRAGATAVFNAGDDTSTGKQWEAFSLDSVSAAFSDYDDRWAVAGNHDNGTFVSRYLGDQGWTMLDGEVVEGPGGSRLLGVDDPRSSGLGTWRDETKLTFGEVAERLADAACAADEDGERVNTILIHDANMGEEALARGCVDLVLGGHLHVREGPTEVVGSNAEVGYSYTTGTTGGAAYAIALGSKLRRPADISLITYADGRPVGVQAVTLQTNGRFDVAEYTPLG